MAENKKEYSKYRTDELLELQELAFSVYYAEAVKPCGNWYPGIRFPELEKATEELNAINDELSKRI